MAHVLEPGHAPTPFTAEEIRAATGDGKSRRIRVVGADGTSYFRTNTFSGCDAEGALLTRERYDATGQRMGEPDAVPVSWLDLQRHASFPAEMTTIEEVALDGPLGVRSCLRYTVRDGRDEDVFWFATDLPGMPIRTESRVDGALIVWTEVVS